MISVVIPTYEEHESIPFLIRELKKVLKTNFEIIVVDDSPDNRTVLVAGEVCRSLRIPYIIKHRRKRGKGSAVIAGIKLSRADIVAVIDADLEYNPKYIPGMIKKLENSDVVTAVRVRRDPFYRQLLAKCFHFLVKILYSIDFDTQSGLKVFRKSRIKNIRIVTEGWTWDVEFLYKCMKKGLRIRTHRINYHSRRFGNSKINILTPLTMFFEIIRLRFKI